MLTIFKLIPKSLRTRELTFRKYSYPLTMAIASIRPDPSARGSFRTITNSTKASYVGTIIRFGTTSAITRHIIKRDFFEL